MTKAIKVTIREVYGVPTVYPACPDAVTFAALARTKTLTDATLRLVERLGYAIETVSPTYSRAR